jgi:hypothetical protein
LKKGIDSTNRFYLGHLSSPCVAPARPGRNPRSRAAFPLLSPPLPAAAGVSRRAKPARRRRRRAVFYPARGGPCGAAPSLAAVRIGGGRRGLAWLLPAGCARGVLPQWRRRQVVVLAVAERRRPLPTLVFNSDEGPRRVGWSFGRRCSGAAKAATFLQQRGGGTSRARSGSGRAEGLVCLCYRVRSATAHGGGGRSPLDGRSAAALRFHRSYPIPLAGCTMGLATRA